MDLMEDERFNTMKARVVNREAGVFKAKQVQHHHKELGTTTIFG